MVSAFRGPFSSQSCCEKPKKGLEVCPVLDHLLGEKLKIFRRLKAVTQSLKDSFRRTLFLCSRFCLEAGCSSILELWIGWACIDVLTFLVSYPLCTSYVLGFLPLLSALLYQLFVCKKLTIALGKKPPAISCLLNAASHYLFQSFVGYHEEHFLVVILCNDHFSSNEDESNEKRIPAKKKKRKRKQPCVNPK